MSLVIDIADAVAAELNSAPSGTFEQAFTAVRRFLPEFELPDLAELKVSVVPRGLEITGATRSASQYEISIDIGVQKKLGRDVDGEVAGLLVLVEQMADYLRRRTLAGAPRAVWAGIANDPVWAAEHLSEQRVFTSVLTVTYRAIR